MHINRKGFTLVELMVVLVILAVIVVGVFGVVITQNKAYHSEETIIDMQANAQIGLQRISRLLRMAGFGCKDNISSTNQITSFSTVITATNNSTTPDSLTVIGGLKRVGIVDDGDTTLNEQFIVTTIPIVRDDTSKPLSYFFDDGSIAPYKQYFYISPADNNDFLSVSAIDTSSLTNAAGNLTISEGDIVYTVRPYTIRLYTDAQGISCLGIDDGSGIDSCADNIEDLQFQYGADTDNDGYLDTWVDAPTLAIPIKDFKAVRVFILARTANPDRKDDYTNNNTYILGDRTDGPFNDHFHRYLLETTVMMRNLNF